MSKSRFLPILLLFALLVPACSPPRTTARDRRLSSLQRQIDGLRRILAINSVPLSYDTDLNSRVSSRVTDPTERAIRLRLLRMRYAAALGVDVSPEPAEDATQGVFLARIVAIPRHSASPTFSADIVTDAVPRQVWQQWLQSHSGGDPVSRDNLGWNRYRHIQSLQLAPDVVLAVRDDGGFHRIVSRDEFAALLRTDRAANPLYYVHIRKGSGGVSQASEVWWCF